MCTHDIKCLEGRLGTASMKVLIIPTGLMFFLKAVEGGSMKAQYWHACVASNAPEGHGA